MRTTVILLAAALAGSAVAGEGLALGAFAPALNGKTWVSADGKMPNMKNKVILVDFWFST